jgi:polyisoprenoid-binding protein YceI
MRHQIETGNFLRKALLFIIAILAISFSNLAFGQTSYQASSKTAEIKVSGTSNLHDWTMNGSGLTAAAEFSMKSAATRQLVSLNQLNFTFPVKNLKSSEGLLNSRAYKALNADKYTQILFKMISADVASLGNNQYQIKALGDLTISGVTKEVSLLANGRVNADGSMTITGSRKMKMTDFGIKPPSFMLGALKTSNDITIDFTLKF